MDKKQRIALHILALKRQLRAVYWSVEVDDDERGYKWLKQTATASGLRISKHSSRLVYNPAMVTEAEVAHAFDSDDEKRIGALLGYPCPGDSWQTWWVSWQVRDPKRESGFTSMFHFQMRRLDTKKLIEMKRRWNAALPAHYFDFEIRYRENGTFDDEVRVMGQSGKK